MEPGTEQTLASLEEQLKPVVHQQRALEIIQKFASDLKKTQKRAELFNSEGALVSRPLIYEHAQEVGAIKENEDLFTILQGDIIGTDSAFAMGERVTDSPKFIVANASCDLVLGRKRHNALLFAVQPIYKPKTPEERSITDTFLRNLLLFNQFQFLYLPPLPGDSDEVAFNVINFDEYATIRIEHLLVANRLVSLSKVGWMLFTAGIAANFTRASESEVEMRDVMAPHLN